VVRQFNGPEYHFAKWYASNQMAYIGSADNRGHHRKYLQLLSDLDPSYT